MASVIIALMKFLGPTLARAILTLVLRDDISGADLAEQLTDSMDIPALLGKVTKEFDTQSDGSYFFAKAGRDAAKSLAIIFEIEGSAIAEAEQEIVAVAVGKTMELHGLKLLLANDLQQKPFISSLLKLQKPINLHAMDYPLYERVLEAAGQIIFESAADLPHFTRDTTAQILRGMRTLLNEWQRFLDEHEQRYIRSRAGNAESRDADFEYAYRNLLASNLDKLHLFGVPQFRNYAQPLSIAYITLNINKEEPEHSQFGEAHFGQQNSNSRLLDASVALANTQRALVIGQAGSGKTTLLKWLAVRAANGDFPKELSDWNDRVPFYVQLRQFANTELPSCSELPLAYKPLSILRDRLSPEWAHSQFSSGRALFLLDGLDEVGEHKRQNVFQWIHNFLTLYPDTIFILSSRPSTIRDDLVIAKYSNLGFAQLKLQPLSKKNIVKLVDRWHEAMGDDRSELRLSEKRILPELAQDLQSYWQDPRNGLLELMENPLMCAMVCALHQVRRSQLPKDKTALYDSCIEMFLEGRDLERAVDLSDYPQLTLREKKRLLARLAYWLMRNGRSEVSESVAENIFEARGYTSQEVLRYFVERSNLLQAVGAKYVSFVHRTFQEYFAATEIHRLNDFGFVVEKCLSTDWKNTILLLASIMETESTQYELISSIISSYDKQNKPHQAYSILWEVWNTMILPTDSVFQLVAAFFKFYRNDRSVTVGIRDDADWGHQASERGRAWRIAKLNSLDIKDAQIKDASPLSEATELQHLGIENTTIQNLEHIRHLDQIISLELRGSPIVDLEFLRSWVNLQHLGISDTKVHNLSPIQNLEKLEVLGFSGTDVSYLDSIQNLTELRALYFGDTKVKSLLPLENLKKLKWFYAPATQIINLEGLEGCTDLQGFNVVSTAISDLSPISELETIKHLNLVDTNVSDLEIIRNFNSLSILSVSDQKIEDFEIFNSLYSLQALYLKCYRLQSITFLKGLKLRLLSIKGKSMNDLSATSNLQNLIALDVRRCPSIKKWFDIEKTPNLCAIWTDDPTNLPKDIEKTIQINPNLNPSDFVRQLESKQKKKD